MTDIEGGGAPNDKPAFDPTQPFAPVQADSGKPPFDPGQPFKAVSQPNTAAPPAAQPPQEIPDIGAPLIGDGGQFSPGTDWGNNAAETAGKTAYGALTNAPHSAYEFARNTVQPFIHPIDTATDLKNLGLGVLEKTGMVSGGDHEKYADAVGHFFADRYGGIENVRKTLETDPVGIAGDLSMLLTGGGGAAARLPGMAARAGEVAGAAGRVIDPVRAASTVGSVAGNIAGKTAAEVAGVTTGVGAQPLKVAAEAGYEGGPAARAFRENLTGGAPLEEAVNDARGAVQQIRKERGDAYRQQMGAVKADSAVLDFSKIDQAVGSAHGIKTYSGRSGAGPAQSLSPKTEGIRKEMTDTIEGWKNLDPAEFHTPEGIDALKQKLGDIRDATQYATPERVAADRIYNAVRQTIVDQVPEYAKVMKGYEQASKQIKDIESTLSLNPKANIDTSLRKLQSTLRDNVNTSFGRRAELANMLVNAGAPHLMERLAGQALHAWVPRGLARLATVEAVPAIAGALGAGAPGAGLAAAGTLPLMSPRLMGEVAYGAGKAARLVRPLTSLARPARQIGRVSDAAGPFGAGLNPYAQ